MVKRFRSTGSLCLDAQVRSAPCTCEEEGGASSEAPPTCAFSTALQTPGMGGVGVERAGPDFNTMLRMGAHDAPPYPSQHPFLLTASFFWTNKKAA